MRLVNSCAMCVSVKQHFHCQVQAILCFLRVPFLSLVSYISTAAGGNLTRSLPWLVLHVSYRFNYFELKRSTYIFRGNSVCTYVIARNERYEVCAQNFHVFFTLSWLFHNYTSCHSKVSVQKFLFSRHMFPKSPRLAFMLGLMLWYS